MEFSTALPADLVAVADPSARGSASLLRSVDADGAPATAALPFADFLALLTTPLPAGEIWPATGKDLPVMPVEREGGETISVLPSVALPLAALASAGATAAPPTQPAATEPPSVALPSNMPPPLSTAAAESAPVEQLPPPADEAAASADSGTQVAADLDPVVFAAAEEPATPLDGVALDVATAPARSRAAPSWLEAFTQERRWQRPAPVSAVDPRAPTSLQPPAATSVLAAQPSAAAAVPTTDGPHAGQIVEPGIELPKLAAHALGGVESATAQAEWLPTPAHGTTTASAAPAASAATPAAPGGPVDTRAPNWQDAFASRVQWIVDQKVGEAHIKLNPPELGAVDVKISLVDDKTFVQLTTATATARDELTQSLPRLRELFTLGGLELGGASVHTGRHGHQAGAGNGYGYGAEPQGSPPFERFAEDRADASVFAPRRSAGRIDVFA